MSRPKPVVLLIFDGWGWYEPHEQAGNAILAAKTPNWDRLLAQAPHTVLSASGEDVGLPDGQMGNSEVGHLTLGSGRTIYQDLTRITKSIEKGEFFQNSTLKEAFNKAATEQKSIHLMALLSAGGVHSHEDHLFAAIQMAAQNHCSQIYIHAFLDGRDTPPQSAKASLEKLQEVIAKTPGAKLASVSGRYYAMDRDKRWERVKLAYDAIVYGQSPFVASSGIEALELAYLRAETDEFVKPTCIVSPHETPVTVQTGDVVVYMNFRSDRARALAYALTSPEFNGFERGNYPQLGEFVGLTEYDSSLNVKVAFAPQTHRNGLGEYLQNQGLSQLRLAETEKYAHVTFFFNGGVEKPFLKEDRVLIPSPKVTTYDQEPQMSAYPLTEKLIEGITSLKYDCIVCNYANADMVGHTGDFTAAVGAIQTLDICLGKILAALDSVGGCALITSDHGNAECMIDSETHQPHTAHTTSLVPLVYYGKEHLHFMADGKLSDVTPTLLQLMGLPKPSEMTGHSLIQPESVTPYDTKTSNSKTFT
uniref:2,3-bisphosphoglycerate-independent phosphoglycerate mutase n=1 Tax=Candidatus Berkiella aquae TaxID=295108 RepID=UPI001F3B33B6|nr:2,3-bisphosphoglycerate-independent phosphoglycerate mutase [Candidatus Berkiella aquae]